MSENTEEVAKERPIRRIRRERLRLLVDEFGGPGRLAAATDTVDTHLIAILKGRRDVGDALADKLERKSGKEHGWMDAPATGLHPKAAEIAAQLDGLGTDPSRQAWALRACEVFAFASPPRTPTEMLEMVTKLAQSLPGESQAIASHPQAS